MVVHEQARVLPPSIVFVSEDSGSACEDDRFNVSRARSSSLVDDGTILCAIDDCCNGSDNVCSDNLHADMEYACHDYLFRGFSPSELGETSQEMRDEFLKEDDVESLGGPISSKKAVRFRADQSIIDVTLDLTHDLIEHQSNHRNAIKKKDVYSSAHVVDGLLDQAYDLIQQVPLMKQIMVGLDDSAITEASEVSSIGQQVITKAASNNPVVTSRKSLVNNLQIDSNSDGSWTVAKEVKSQKSQGPDNVLNDVKGVAFKSSSSRKNHCLGRSKLSSTRGSLDSLLDPIEEKTIAIPTSSMGASFSATYAAESVTPSMGFVDERLLDIDSNGHSMSIEVAPAQQSMSLVGKHDGKDASSPRLPVGSSARPPLSVVAKLQGKEDDKPRFMAPMETVMDALSMSIEVAPAQQSMSLVGKHDGEDARSPRLPVGSSARPPLSVVAKLQGKEDNMPSFMAPMETVMDALSMSIEVAPAQQSMSLVGKHDGKDASSPRLPVGSSARPSLSVVAKLQGKEDNKPSFMAPMETVADAFLEPTTTTTIAKTSSKAAEGGWSRRVQRCRTVLKDIKNVPLKSNNKNTKCNGQYVRLGGVTS